MALTARSVFAQSLRKRRFSQTCQRAYCTVTALPRGIYGASVESRRQNRHATIRNTRCRLGWYFDNAIVIYKVVDIVLVLLYCIIWIDFHNEIIKFIQYFSWRSDFHFALRSDNPRKKRFGHLNAYVNGICVIIYFAYPYRHRICQTYPKVYSARTTALRCKVPLQT